MASLRCHGNSDVNETWITTNFHFYMIQLLHLANANVINIQEVSPPKIQSSHLYKK